MRRGKQAQERLDKWGTFGYNKVKKVLLKKGVIEMSKRPADSAFTLLFNNEKYVVDLYEFLTGIRLEPHTIESVRLKDDLFRSRLYNDVSFVTHDNQLLVLIEHQSTLNPNMAFRILEYYVKLASENMKKRNVTLFGTKAVQIPKARFFVVYNGKGKMPELPLLDLGDVQVKATVKNIHFEALPDQSKTNTVAGYARFVELAREVDSAYEALDLLLEEGYLQEFLSDKERKKMFAEVYSYDNELRYEGLQKGRQEGLQEGLQKGRQEGLQEGLQKGQQEGLQEGLQKGQQEGLQEGLQKGQQEKAIEIAQASLANGLDVEMIALITGLEIEKIKSLASIS